MDLDLCKYLYCTAYSVHCNVIIGTIYLKQEPRCTVILGQHAQLPLERYVFTPYVVLSLQKKWGRTVASHPCQTQIRVFSWSHILHIFLLILLNLLAITLTLIIIKIYPRPKSNQQHLKRPCKRPTTAKYNIDTHTHRSQLAIFFFFFFFLLFFLAWWKSIATSPPLDRPWLDLKGLTWSTCGRPTVKAVVFGLGCFDYTKTPEGK